VQVNKFKTHLSKEHNKIKSWVGITRVSFLPEKRKGGGRQKVV
jgi:hypothetical protein